MLDDDVDTFICSECGDECLEPNEDGVCQICAQDAQWLDDAEDDLIDGVGFADPGGRSALRAATESNPRNLPCPNCGAANRLTPLDKARGYQCDACADALERGGY